MNPVERLVARQPIEHFARALADETLEAGDVGGCRDWRHRLALRRVARRVHANEIADLSAYWLIGDLDAAMLRGRGERGVVELYGRNVIVAGYRPVRPIGALGAIMDRRLPAQPSEQRSPAIVCIELRIADVDLVE